MRMRSKRYSIDAEKSYVRSRLIVVAGAVLLVALYFFVVWRHSPSILRQPSVAVPEVQAPVAESVAGKYLFSGTIVMARAVERAAAGNYDQPFSKFDSFNPGQYDGWLADLECPATDKVISYQEQVQNLVFNCNPVWFPALSKNFTMFNLANNHTGDMGADGFAETQKNLDDAGFQTVGSYDPASTKDACEVMALPVHVTKSDESVADGTLPIAFCAFHYFFRTPLPGEMDIAGEYAKLMPVFGLMHAGVEYRPNADDIQKSVAHALIDQGTEFVIGNSPHWVQESEVYKGKPIFYSTGNFIFDQLEYEEQRGLSIAVAVNVEWDENVQKWLDLGESCKTRADDCLAAAKQQGLSKIAIDLDYTPVGSSGGNKRLTQLADPTLQASIEDRLRWSATKAALDQ